eukprot:CFRG1145T1
MRKHYIALFVFALVWQVALASRDQQLQHTNDRKDASISTSTSEQVVASSSVGISENTSTTLVSSTTSTMPVISTTSTTLVNSTTSTIPASSTTSTTSASSTSSEVTLAYSTWVSTPTSSVSQPLVQTTATDTATQPTATATDYTPDLSSEDKYLNIDRVSAHTTQGGTNVLHVLFMLIISAGGVMFSWTYRRQLLRLIGKKRPQYTRLALDDLGQA